MFRHRFLFSNSINGFLDNNKHPTSNLKSQFSRSSTSPTTRIPKSMPSASWDKNSSRILRKRRVNKIPSISWVGIKTKILQNLNSKLQASIFL
jgi:hypothetical protein